MNAVKIGDYNKLNAELFAGDGLEVRAVSLFRSAVISANEKNYSEALSFAQESMVYANMLQLSIRVGIHKLMAALCYDVKKYDQGKLHCWHGIQQLNKKDKNYFSDKQYLETLLRMIEDARNVKNSETVIKSIAQH